MFGTDSENTNISIAKTNDSEKDIKKIKISKRTLTNNEKHVLNRGLKFTPVPSRHNSNELKNDI